MMHAARILSVVFLLGLLSEPSRANPGRAASSLSTADRMKESRTFILTAGQSVIDLARPFIIPGTDSITVNRLPLKRGSDYRINTLKGSIVLVAPAAAGDTLVARFSRYPLPFSYLFVTHVAEGSGISPIEPTPQLGAPAEERRVEEPYQLRLSGSKTVGVSIGSNKDLGLDQSFKVTMVGKVAKDLEVNAFLTDDNFPIQPEGNTEELKYLDRVYVQVKSRHAEVQLGDFSSGLSWTRFSTFQRELRGITANVGVLGQSFVAGGRDHQGEVQDGELSGARRGAGAV